jgi:hypothetical protein
MDFYHKKYYKYKMKYLNLLNNFHGGVKKYTVLDDFYTYKPGDNWLKKYDTFHAFPEHINDIIEFVGRDINILEVGSGAGIIASRLANDGNINMTCTDTSPPDKIFHECYMIENPFINQESVNKKCIDGNIIQEDYQVPNFDALLIVWPPIEQHFVGNYPKWYRPENILQKALEINKNLKVIVIGEYSNLDDNDTKEYNNNSTATGTFEFWKLLKDSFEEVENIENLYGAVRLDYNVNESTIFYKPKKILSTLELQERYDNLYNKFVQLKRDYIKLKERYKHKPTTSEHFILYEYVPKQNQFFVEKEYQDLKYNFELIKYYYKKLKNKYNIF